MVTPPPAADRAATPQGAERRRAAAKPMAARVPFLNINFIIRYLFWDKYGQDKDDLLQQSAEIRPIQMAKRTCMCAATTSTTSVRQHARSSTCTPTMVRRIYVRLRTYRSKPVPNERRASEEERREGGYMSCRNEKIDAEKKRTDGRSEADL